ncbi:MAG: glutathione S-transferase family protein [Pseudomonadota bacterium]
MATDLILHHFDSSPFAEKIRLILGAKSARWRSVKIPMLMPKPDVVALTGGYRRTPTLQIGADIWCDSALIARVIDQRLAGPVLHPKEVPLAPVLAQWADWTLFWSVIDFASQPACIEHRFSHLSQEERAAIAADRTPFRASVPRLTADDAAANLNQYLATLQAQLASGHEFLLGPLTIADFSVAHCLWHLRRAGPPAQSLVAPYTRLLEWHERILAFGHGSSDEMRSADAVAIAAQAQGHEPTTFVAQAGLAQGQRIAVAATDYGMEPSEGILVGLSPSEVVLSRTDARAGTVHVHFPRAGFRIVPSGA